MGIIIAELIMGKLFEWSDHFTVKEAVQSLPKDHPIYPLVVRMLLPEMSLRPTISEIFVFMQLNRPIEPSLDSKIEKLLWQIRLSWYEKISRNKLKSFEVKIHDEVKKAAEDGNTKAMFLYARMLCQSTGENKNLEESVRWLKEAAAKGEVLSYCNLFQLEDDNELAKPYLQKGLELKDERCIWFTAKGLIHGFYGFEEDQKKGLEILDKLPADFPDAKYERGRALKSINNLAIEFPPELSHHFLEGAQLGHKKAVEALG